MFLYEGGRKKQIAAILLMIFSLGIYQAYITVTILLLLLALVHGLLFENDTAASSFRKALGYLVSGLLVGVGYFVLLQVFLLVRHDAINRDGALDISAYIRNIPHGIKESVLRFFSFFFDLSNGVSLRKSTPTPLRRRRSIPSSAVLPALTCPTAPISACSTGRRFLSC